MHFQCYFSLWLYVQSLFCVQSPYPTQAYIFCTDFVYSLLFILLVYLFLSVLMLSLLSIHCSAVTLQILPIVELIKDYLILSYLDSSQLDSTQFDSIRLDLSYYCHSQMVLSTSWTKKNMHNAKCHKQQTDINWWLKKRQWLPYKEPVHWPFWPSSEWKHTFALCFLNK